MSENNSTVLSSTLQQRIAAVDKMEEGAKTQLASLVQKGNVPIENKVDESEAKLDNYCIQFRNWLLDNTDPEKVKEATEKFKDSVMDLLSQTQEEVSELSVSQEFHDTVQAGKSFFSGIGNMISQGFKHGYDELMGIADPETIPESKKD